MKRKILKVIVCMLMSILIISTILNIFSLAGDEDNRFGFENIANTAGSDKLNSPVRKIAMTIISTVKIASISIAVVILIVISMRYMISAPSDRADIKKHAVPYVIGVIILFGASGILTIIQNLAGIFDESQTDGGMDETGNPSGAGEWIEQSK